MFARRLFHANEKALDPSLVQVILGTSKCPKISLTGKPKPKAHSSASDFLL